MFKNQKVFRLFLVLALSMGIDSTVQSVEHIPMDHSLNSPAELSDHIRAELNVDIDDDAGGFAGPLQDAITYYMSPEKNLTNGDKVRVLKKIAKSFSGSFIDLLDDPEVNVTQGFNATPESKKFNTIIKSIRMEKKRALNLKMRQLLSGSQFFKFFEDKVTPEKIIKEINTFEKDILDFNSKYLS